MTAAWLAGAMRRVSPKMRAHPRHLDPVGSGLEPGAPFSGVELRRLGLLEESLEHRDEAPRRIELRQVADPVEDLQAAAGDGLVGVLAVVDGDDWVTRTPDDEDRHALGEVEPVAGVDALTACADDRVQRGEEGGAAPGVGERRVAASDLGDARAGRSLAAARPRASAAPAKRPAVAVAAMNTPAPGSAAARRTGLTSGPRPPLETSTRRSVISGNW